MQSTSWTPQHSEALREYLAKGMSYSEIADSINAKFKTAYSRNAAIGRATRMGLAGSDRPKDSPNPPPKQHQPQLYKLRNRSAPSLPHGAGTRRLPLPLRRRRGGRSHRLLRPPAAKGLKLLRSAFSPDARPRHRVGTRCRHRLTQDCGGGMKREPRLTPATQMAKMKPLPRRHRIAHLRALIR